METPLPRATWLDALDVALLFVALSLAAWIALSRRSRKAMIALSLACLVYFGFVRAGCICPIGAIQNVTQGAFDSSYYLPFSVIAFFILPLAFALVFGRVFCACVCWLGAMQDLVLLKPLTLPMWLQKSLRIVPFLYLGASVLFAATGALYIICRYDPFVPFFRFTGPVVMFVAGGLVLLASMFVGRPYCRFLCPMGALLSIVSRFSWKGVTITPDHCINCGGCRNACPFGAIQPSDAGQEDAK
jgi:polyferredoxin